MRINLQNPTEFSDERKKEVPSELYDENYYLNLAGGYDLYAKTHGTELDPRGKSVLDLIKSNTQTKVLDIGIGRGEFLKAILREQKGFAVGMDYSAASLNIAKDTLHKETMLGRCHLIRGNAISLPFARSTFDFITMLDVVEHLYPHQLMECFVECRRVLKDSGKLLIHTFPNKLCWNYGYPVVRIITNLWRKNTSEKLPKNPRTDYDKILHVNEQTRWSLKSALKKAKFNHVKVWEEFPNPTPFMHFLVRGGSWKRRFFFKFISLPLLKSIFYNDIYAIAD